MTAGAGAPSSYGKCSAIPFDDEAGKWTAIGWYVAIGAACAVIGAAVMTVCGLWLFIGVELDVTAPVSRIVLIGLKLAAHEAGVVCPLIALPAAQLPFHLRRARDEVAEALTKRRRAGWPTTPNRILGSP